MPTLGVVFPGQGSQAAAMGVDVAAASPAAKQVFERASAVLGYDVLELCAHGSEERMRDTRTSQPAIFTVNVAIYRALEPLGFTSIVSAGHSFGEYCSLTIAGALALEEAVRLVNERGLAMGDAADLAPGGMAAIIGFDQGQAEAVCVRARAQSNGRVDVANLNAPVQIVVSGDLAAVQAASALAKEAGAKRVVMLNVSGAWHSELMQPAVARFERVVAAAHIGTPSFTVISNVDVEPYRDAAHIRNCLIASLTSRVRWHETAEAVVATRPDVIVECGATPVLAPLIRRLPGVAADRVLHVADAGGIAKLAALAEAVAT